MKTLENKVALITGSSRGLGRAIAERYAELGAHIIINYTKNQSAADEVLNIITAKGVKAIAVHADINKPEEISHLFQEALAAFARIDIVVANAGLEMVDVPVDEITETQFKKLFNLNTKGTFFTLQEAAKNVADGGCIINISSSTTIYLFGGFYKYTT